MRIGGLITRTRARRAPSSGSEDTGGVRGDVNRRPITSKIKPNRPVTTSILALSYNETYWTTTHTQPPGIAPNTTRVSSRAAGRSSPRAKPIAKQQQKTSDENERIFLLLPHPLISANFSNCRMGVR
jgi:hypothetical protein